MKTSQYTDIICKGFCRFYKEGREGLACGGYSFLRNNLTMRELKSILAATALDQNLKNQIPAENKDLSTLVCRKCDFFIGGCDYAENRSSPPCGGYIVIHKLLEKAIA